MCRLLGIYGQVDFWQEIVMKFRQLADTGKIPPEENLKPGHQDGWGMAMSNQNKTAMIPLIRQLGSASASLCYSDVVTSMAIQPDVFLCHLRKASAGIPITLSNAHPFFCNQWAFIHNGSVYRAESLPRAPFFRITSNGSDSEHFFHYLLTKMADEENKKSQLEKIAETILNLDLDYTALNSMLSDGQELFVIRSYQKYEDYYSLYYYKIPYGVIVCSEIIESGHLNPNQWQLLRNDSFLRIHGHPPVIEKI
jgi:predicted glutamine amidotransferase